MRLLLVDAHGQVGASECSLLVGERETHFCEGSQSLGIDYVR